MKRSRLNRRTPLRPRSAKRAQLYRKHRVPVVAALLDGAVCARCQATRAVDMHELRKRSRGGSILDEGNLAALCRSCHDWTEMHPAQAQAEGWLHPSGIGP